jgi:hypothetical protein
MSGMAMHSQKAARVSGPMARTRLDRRDEVVDIETNA